MPTRFYLPSTGTAPASPVFSPEWNVTTSAVRLPLVTTKTNTTATTVARGETSATPANVLVNQWISSQTIPSARTIGTGTISAAISNFQGYANGDYFTQIVAKVVSGDGATVRGYLYSGSTAAAVSTTAGAQNQEMTVGTTGTRIWNSIPLTSVAAQAGDRIVVEVGGRALNAGTFNYTFSMRLGDSYATDTALAADDAPATNGNAWVEFSEDIFGAAPGSSSGTLGGTLPKLTGSFAGSYTPPTVTGTLGGSLPALTGSFAGSLPNAPVDGTLGGTLPALVGSLAGDVSAPVVETSTTYANLGGYNYHGESEVDYDPPVAPSPARVKPTPIQRVHQSLPVPTLVNGRPV